MYLMRVQCSVETCKMNFIGMQHNYVSMQLNHDICRHCFRFYSQALCYLKNIDKNAIRAYHSTMCNKSLDSSLQPMFTGTCNKSKQKMVIWEGKMRAKNLRVNKQTLL